jgi:integrase
MGWPEKTPNGLYKAVWRDDKGRRHSKSGFTHKSKAMRFANEEEGKARRGELAYNPKGPTWGEWADRWVQLRVVDASSARGDEMRLRRYLRPQWENWRLSAIDTDDVQAWVNRLETTTRLSPGSIRLIYYLFSASMKAAVPKQIAVTPCRRIKLPPLPPPPERHLTRAEFDLVAYHFSSRVYRAAMITLVGTGIRFGEMAGLHWSNVDLENRLLTVTNVWDPEDGVIKSYPKSKKPRHVPLPQMVVDALLEIGIPSRATCGIPHARGTACNSPLVFYSQTGLPLRNSTFRDNHWLPALKRAGVEPCRLHDLRHTYASWLRQDGIDLQVVQEMLGHGSIITTQRYSHIGSTQNERVLKALGG